MVDVKIAQLLKSGVHLGHKTSRWNPKMFPYIFMEQEGVHIIDLVQTSKLLKEACDFVQIAAEKNKTFLFVGTKSHVANIIKEQARNCKSYYVNHRWYGGLLTNWKTVKQRIQKLINLEQQEQTIFPNLGKKEVSSLRKELNKLQVQLEGIKDMKKIPDIIIIVDQTHELTAVREALKLKIPIISILDSNCDPDLVDLPIPGNDDSISSIKLILSALSSSICLGKS